ncbi:MAG: glycosyltransferase family 1 protein [Candidatus Omnitrophica bacterium]|nr:glycosyltransferase family 1 protein [Candidatus Omnitrophota bacterium]
MLKKASTLIQIVPQMPPIICGVGDYAVNLAKQLRDSFGIDSRFVVCNPDWRLGKVETDYIFTVLTKRSWRKLLAVLTDYSKENAIVILHYVGYGYAKRGCPIWLLKGILYWRNKFPNIRLGIVFHEVYACDYPWRSSFWLSPLSKHIAAGLFSISDFCFTTTQTYADKLHKLDSNKQDRINVLPVFSNVKEPASSSLLSKRKQHLVIFGKDSNRSLVYNNCLDILKIICIQLKIEEIHDIGAPINRNFPKIEGVPIIEHGPLSSKAIGEFLSGVLAGVLTISPGSSLAKSSVFASYCAHRVIPIVVTLNQSVKDGLFPGKHYWLPSEDGSFSLEEGQLQADNAYDWYQNHCLSAHARAFVESF